MNEYIKKYCEQMDQVTLSDAADKAVLDELLKADSRKGVPYMKWTKRNLSAAMIAAIITMASVTAVFAGVAGTIMKSNKSESKIEGVGAKIDVGESYYFDILSGDSGEIYTLTSNHYDSALTGHHVIAWKSMDQGDTWIEVLSQPDELSEESDLIAGDLRKGENGIEAVVIMSEMNDEEKNGQVNWVYQITSDSYVKYDMEEVFAELGAPEHLFNVKYVNNHTIALVGTEKCLLYDTNSQKIVKKLPYDLTMGCLKTLDQFLIYGQEIYSCLNAETLEEQEPEEGLREFVKMMLVKNSNIVLPPMAAWNDTIVCVTTSGIYEYKDGETTQTKQLSDKVNNGSFFNGLLPVCKAGDGEYYICAFQGDGEMSLWQITGDKEEMK